MTNSEKVATCCFISLGNYRFEDAFVRVRNSVGFYLVKIFEQILMLEIFKKIDFLMKSTIIQKLLHN